MKDLDLPNLATGARLAGLVLVASVLLQTPAYALIYNEANDGDLAGGSAGELSPGMNTISGSLADTDFLDNFSVDLLDGVISQITLTVSNATDPLDVVETCLQIVAPMFTACLPDDGEISPPVSLFPLEPGTYDMQAVFSGSLIGVSSDWVIEITVLTPTPAPGLNLAGLLTLSGALLVVGVHNLRRLHVRV